MKQTILFSSLLTVATGSSTAVFAEKSKDADKPMNVLFIMADDFNYWASCTGYYPESKTPNIDALASKGVLFPNSFCSSPVSNPSRNALWSGLRPSTTGIMSNGGGYVRTTDGFEDVVTMNQYFKENGYHVFGSGKLYHPGKMGGEHTDPENWSELNTSNTGSTSPGGVVAAWNNPSWAAMKYKIGKSPMDENNCADYSLALQVADLITNYSDSENGDKPFFIGCGFFRPHLPWNISSTFWDLYEGVDLPLPQGYFEDDLSDLPNKNPGAPHRAVVEAGKWQESIRAYLSGLSLADYNVGVLLDALEKSPHKDNTIVVFLGDHGWQLGEKASWGKATVYNAANKTGLIIYNPRTGSTTQHTCPTPVSLQDLYPTLVEMCNLPDRQELEGCDISPLVENPECKEWNRPVLSSFNGTHYIQDKEYKYIDGKAPQLYKIDEDPYEFHNLYKSAKDPIVVKYKAKLDSMLNIGAQIRVSRGLPAQSVSIDVSKK